MCFFKLEYSANFLPQPSSLHWKGRSPSKKKDIYHMDIINVYENLYAVIVTNDLMNKEIEKNSYKSKRILLGTDIAQVFFMLKISITYVHLFQIFGIEVP